MRLQSSDSAATPDRSGPLNLLVCFMHQLTAKVSDFGFDKTRACQLSQHLVRRDSKYDHSLGLTRA